MLFPSTAISQLKTLSDASLGHLCTITDTDGSVYDGPAHVFDDAVNISHAVGGDASFDADALIRLPHQSHANWSNKTFDQDSATVKATYEGVKLTGKVTQVMRRQSMCFVGVNWLDAAESTTLGTITDLEVLLSGAGGAVLTFTVPSFATSMQAQVDASDSGAAVGPTLGIITLTGLTAGSRDFTVVATDGTNETTSNEVTATVL